MRRGTVVAFLFVLILALVRYELWLEPQLDTLSPLGGAWLAAWHSGHASDLYSLCASALRRAVAIK